MKLYSPVEFFRVALGRRRALLAYPVQKRFSVIALIGIFC